MLSNFVVGASVFDDLEESRQRQKYSFFVLTEIRCFGSGETLMLLFILSWNQCARFACQTVDSGDPAVIVGCRSLVVVGSRQSFGCKTKLQRRMVDKTFFQKNIGLDLL